MDQPLRFRRHALDCIHSARLRAFLEVALAPYRQYGGRGEADRLGEAWMEAEVRI
jgi:hypothetical protein